MNQEQIKNKALTQLFNDQRLRDTIQYVCIKHKIPLDAHIQDDILQVIFENLIKYPTAKFVEAYEDNPIRILKLAKKILLWKGVYTDKRSKKGWNHSIAQQLIYQSTLATLQHIDSIDTTTDEYNIPLFNDHDAILEQEEDDEEKQMWLYVKQNITTEENQILDTQLQQQPKKLKGIEKKIFQNLLPKMKIIITNFKNQKSWK